MRIYLSIVPGIDESFENQFRRLIYEFISNKINKNESKRIEVQIISDDTDNVNKRENLISVCDMAVLIDNWMFDPVCDADKQYLEHHKIPHMIVKFKRTSGESIYFKEAKFKYAKLYTRKTNKTTVQTGRSSKGSKV